MKKSTKLKICDILLIPIAVIMLASSIQLEGWWLGMSFIWIHIAVGIIFYLLIAWHLQLHFKWHDWVKKLSHQKSRATKWLAALCFLTLLTAIAATIHMLISWRHSAIGSWHGNIGFIFLILAIGHIIKRWKFYNK